MQLSYADYVKLQQHPSGRAAGRKACKVLRHFPSFRPVVLPSHTANFIQPLEDLPSVRHTTWL